MNRGKLTVNLRKGAAMRVTRVSVGRKKLVYVLVAGKPQKYPLRPSRVVYIGTTKKGIARIAQSVAARANRALALHGVKELAVRVITCAPRPNVKTWFKLERAMLTRFRGMYGALPRLNKYGPKSRLHPHRSYFSTDRLERILEELS